MGNRNKKNTIKDLFYLILGTSIISLSIYLLTFTPGDSVKPSPNLVYKHHETIDRSIEKKSHVEWDDKVLEAPRVELVQLANVEEEEEKPNGTWQIFEVTAYTAGVESTGKSPGHPLYGVTASGNKVQRYHTIACPLSLEFGTEIYIPKLDNTYVCEDRGSAIVEGRLDIYMKDLDKALAFGRQELKVFILEGEG